jgi:transposase
MQATAATLPELPTDVAALQALLLATMAERDALTTERDALRAQNERLAHLLVQLRRMQFGRKSERLPEDQLQLAIEDTEAAIAKVEAETEQRDPALRREQAT